MRKGRGFLLFEVMVAVTMVGIAMATVLQSISYALVTARVTKDYLLASSLLSEKLWEVNSKGSADPGIAEGSFADHPEFRYRVTVEELFPGEASATPGTSSTAQAKSLNKVTVALSWNFRGKTKRLSAQTYLPTPDEEPAPPPAQFLS